jgi:hypothetical protein
LASLETTTLLTRGYFEVLFANEEGVKVAWKTSAVEWGGLQLSFSKYVPNFDSNAQGAEILFSKSIKVQFLNLHE